ncbi:protein ANTAGONIST OF LIKE HETEROCHROMATIN PROTEIN 1-like isoform X2 [Oryza brachyantha]|uniref:protein ANTAGONIST OF LIKE HETEROCHROMATIN PROTEIN 1-like isoform X2 n=1 Tax=Oryza brachyantha TaxID=4533 RepID=UPI001ADC3703|nr:protein ANTAGONIST OF LIKE HETEROCHROMATIN PROTEIN 1-like isoform X2 [Oryza brachyantha]
MVAASAGRKRRSRPAPAVAPATPEEEPPQLTSLLALLASSVSLALRFASDRDLLLHPSQMLELDPLVLSAARAVSRLLAMLPLHLQTLTLTSMSLSPPTPSPPLPSSWFLRLLSASHSLPDSAWRDAFRMSRPAFFQLLHSLALSDPASSSSSSLALPPDHKLGAALFRLAHAAPARAVARRFGLPSPAVAARAFYEVCRAIADRLAILLDLGAPDRIARAVPGFCALSLPNCCGALGYARIGDAVIAQALVDAEGRFLDVSVGWDAAMGPAEILPRTKLYSSQSLVLANAPHGELIGGSVPRYFLGPACCPMLPWLVTPYNDMDAKDDMSKESIFNHVHSHGMRLVRNAFAHVRSRWRLLDECWKGECQEALPYVVVAGCLLHNFLIKCDEPAPEEVQRCAAAEQFPDFEGEKDKEGERIRDVLAAHLSLTPVTSEVKGDTSISTECSTTKSDLTGRNHTRSNVCSTVFLKWLQLAYGCLVGLSLQKFICSYSVDDNTIYRQQPTIRLFPVKQNTPMKTAQLQFTRL